MKNKLSLLMLSAVTLLSTACDKEKIPLKGDRESFISLDESLRPDKDLQSKTIHVPTPHHNKDWPQVGGNVQHLMPNLALDHELTLAWHESIGQGSGSGQRLVSNVVVADDVVYAMDALGTISAHDLNNGQVLFKKVTSPDGQHDEALGGGVAVDNGILFATTSFGEVLALNLKTGEELWRSKTATPIRMAPTVHKGRVYVLTISNDLHAFNATNGSELWTHSGITESASLLGAATPAVADNVVIAAYSSGEFYALQADNGQPLWTDTLTSAIRVDTVSSIPHIKARPVVDNGIVYTISHGGRMVATEIKSGIRQWQREVGGTRTPAIVGDFLFMLTTTNEVIALEKKTGKVKWTVALPRVLTESKKAISWAGPVAVNDQLSFASSHGEIVFINIKDGKISKTLSFDGGSHLSPVVADKKLIILSDNGYISVFK